MSRGWEGGSTRAWRATRLTVLIRDNWRCRLGLEGCTIRATDAHHLDGKGAGDSVDRIVASCRHCNASTGDPSTADPAPRTRTLW